MLKSLGILMLVLVLLLALVGCNTSPLAYLDLAVGALEVALPLIGPAAGLPPDVVAQVGSYLAGVSQAATQASDILAGPGTDAQKSAQILAAFAGIAEPIVPVQYQAIVSAVQQVALYVAKFIASIPAASPTAATPLSASSQAKLKTIRARAVAVHSAVRR